MPSPFAPKIALDPEQRQKLESLSAPARRPRPWPDGSASSSAPPGRTTPPTSGSPASWAPRGTPSHSGGVATPRKALPASRMPRDPADRRSFPPEGQLQVISIATSDPADQGCSATRWSLDEIARTIVNQARHEEMSRSTIWRILEDADLRPHKSRYWLNSHDPDFDAKAERICRLYLDAPVLYRRGELVLCCDEKTGMQILERKYPTNRPSRASRGGASTNTSAMGPAP